jgi:hypothetical protein
LNLVIDHSAIFTVDAQIVERTFAAAGKTLPFILIVRVRPWFLRVLEWREGSGYMCPPIKERGWKKVARWGEDEIDSLLGH